MAKELTKIQRKILVFVDDHINEKGYVPSYKEIGAGVGFKGASGAQYHIDRLVWLGFIKKPKDKSRVLIIVEDKKGAIRAMKIVDGMT